MPPPVKAKIYSAYCEPAVLSLHHGEQGVITVKPDQASEPVVDIAPKVPNQNPDNTSMVVKKTTTSFEYIATRVHPSGIIDENIAVEVFFGPDKVARTIVCKARVDHTKQWCDERKGWFPYGE